MRNIGLQFVFALCGAASLASALPAFGAVIAPVPARAEMTGDGLIWVTPTGMTLYTYRADDSTPGKSQCVNVPHPAFSDPTGGFGSIPLPRADAHKSCSQKWPPYLADEQAQPGSDWSLIDRPEGGKQWAYRSHPLYTSIKDHKAGDRNGAVSIGQANLGGRGWSLAMSPLNLPPGLTLLRREEGLVLATLNNRPVYTSLPGVEHACYNCEKLFQPISAPALSSVSGDWAIVGAGAGVRQYAYKHKALYVAPAGMSDGDIAEAGGWETVVFRKSPGNPPEIGKHLSLLGEVFTDKQGSTLYAFTCVTPAGDGVRCDDPGDAAEYWAMLCADGKECARRWRPYQAPANSDPKGDWTVVDVAYPMFSEASGFTYPPDAPRVRTWAYRGMPVYTYYEDKAPGDIRGDGIRLFSFSGFYALQVPGRGLLD